MVDSVARFLGQTATKGSWYGGGSAAALSCALAAALLEKLARPPRLIAELRAIRRRGVALVDRDAETFARVIHTLNRGNRQASRRTLKAATEIPRQVFQDAQRLLILSRAVRRTISPRFRVDLACAVLLANASGRAARALVATNLAWLGDRAYSRRLRRKLARLA